MLNRTDALGCVGTAATLNLNFQPAAEVLPSFFIIGPPRTGTTWLHRVLREHASLPNSIKETRFFDRNFHHGIAWYRGHYERFAPGRLVGEVAPTYFASFLARERIAYTVPRAKVVCIFRNPVERVLSLYRLKRAYGRIPWSFEQAMVRDPELLESSEYASNLRAWRDAFGSSQVLACVYDDLESDPQSYVNAVADFIEIPRFTLIPAHADHLESSDALTHPRNYYRTRGATLMADWLKKRRLGKLVSTIKNSRVRQYLLAGGTPFADLSIEFLQGLYEVFRGEVEQLEVLLNRDLSAWKSLAVTPTLSAAA